jgi:1-acyl-sn-glycerol-3-phosphate acyltransferase
VVANHNSHLDAPLLLSLFSLRRLPRVHPVAAADYFGETRLRRTVAMLLMNAVPIQRSPGAGQDPLAHVIRALQEGRSIILFPEGTRGEAGVVAPFRSGVGRIVRAVPDVPVVPVFLRGPERIWPRGEVVPVPQGIDVHVGKPRTYDATREPREIAEQARTDVLALAPHEAPPPGARAAAPPVFVAVCGGGGAERRAAVEALLREVSVRMGRALGLTDRVIVAEKGAWREDPSCAVPRKGWHEIAARVVRARPPYDGPRFADLVRRGRWEQGLCGDPDARAVVAEGAALVAFLASGVRGVEADDRELYQRLLFATAQRRIPFRSWWRVVRDDPEVWLLDALSLARLREPAVLVLLDDDPATRRVADLLRRTRRTEIVRPSGPEGLAGEAAEACVRASGDPIAVRS